MYRAEQRAERLLSVLPVGCHRVPDQPRDVGDQALCDGSLAIPFVSTTNTYYAGHDILHLNQLDRIRKTVA